MEETKNAVRTFRDKKKCGSCSSVSTTMWYTQIQNGFSFTVCDVCNLTSSKSKVDNKKNINNKNKNKIIMEEEEDEEEMLIDYKEAPKKSSSTLISLSLEGMNE